jgi:sugar/nucleoside kinase (ribokinase family)
MEKPFDIIGVGDTVIDAFIKLEVGHTEETAKGTELCMPYGAKVPYESVTIVPAVGNSANAVVSASRLGLNTALVTFLGNDKHGKECLERLEKEKVSTKFITEENDKPTNYHYVLWYGDDRTILIKHTAFKSVLPNIGNPKWIYLSSLGAHTKDLHFSLAEYMRSHPETKLAFQPGTFQLELKHELAELYKETNVLCMNKEEAEELLNIQGDDPTSPEGSAGQSIKKLLDGLQALGPETVIITDGSHGAYLRYDHQYLNMPVYPDIAPPLERTGAGDAFFSTFISYLAKGYDETEAIKRAPINSMNVVQHIGAQEGLLSEEKIEEYLKNAPEGYKLTILD